MNVGVMDLIVVWFNSETRPSTKLRVVNVVLNIAV